MQRQYRDIEIQKAVSEVGGVIRERESNPQQADFRDNAYTTSRVGAISHETHSSARYQRQPENDRQRARCQRQPDYDDSEDEAKDDNVTMVCVCVSASARFRPLDTSKLKF